MTNNMVKRENTIYLVQMYNEKQITFGDCIDRIKIIGDIHLLDTEKLKYGKIDINE